MKLSATQQHRLNLELKPIFIGQLIVLDELTQPAFSFEQGEYKLAHAAGKSLTKEFIAHYAKNIGKNIFVYQEDYRSINFSLKDELTKMTRSLSIGDITKNASRQVNFLTMQMANIYKNPYDDELLSHQFQNSKNLSTLLLNNKGIHRDIYHSLAKQSFHYTHKQPMLSSILVLSFMQSLKQFSDKEIQNFFLASYFKDIGMSFIPREKFELSNLSDFDKTLFSEHSENSMKLLNGRVPLNQGQLNLIKNHHYLNLKIQALVRNEVYHADQEFLSGIESAIVSTLDILVAMTSERPYREALSHYKALEFLKRVISDEYPQEFKFLVVFIKNFFQS
ncbi:MAG: hypothetical protein CME62_11790 [Halobacteriovoraceae bacterium]|nr:hypothetical protein [Halobacteriovoraceae bacterium]|tara:strand:+ start:6224 stop:7228 length:1005 start_codon:yes stop_codon:yes gene_type:complete